MKAKGLLSILFSLIILQGISQTQNVIDSIENLIKTSPDDTNKVNTLIDFARKSYTTNLKCSFKYGYKALQLSKKIHFFSGEASASNLLGVCHYQVGNLDSSEICYLRALNLAVRYKFKKIQIKATGNLGLVYTNLGKYDKAIEYLNKSLKANESINDSASIARNCADIASIYSYTNKFDLSVSYNKRALGLFRALGMKSGEANVLNSIGSTFQDLKKYKEAMFYFNQSAKIKESIGDKKGLANTYHNMGFVYADLHQNDSAQYILEKSLKLNQEIDNKEGLANDKISLGLIYSEKGNEKKAIEYYLSAYNLSQDIGAMIFSKYAAKDLSTSYEKTGDIKNAFLYYKRYKEISDSLKSVEIEKKISEVEGLYQTEKKQKEIELLEKDKALQKTELNRQKVQKFAFIGGFAFMLILAFVIFRSYRQKRKANILLKEQKHQIEEKNEELNQQNEEITAQRDEIEAQRDEITAQRDMVTNQRDEIESQRDLVTKQKDHIEEQKKEITDSINYAKRIQQAVLPTGEYAKSIMGDHFILFKPKDIVSGDFFWATRVNEWLIVTVADCTGHGVPGAFMSMLGVSFLNEIVRKKEITKASEVLDHLRESIIEALQQKGQSGEQKDGLDIALCALDTTNNTLQYAGANNPLYVVTSDKVLKEIYPDKQPVGIHSNMTPFTNQIISVHKGDVLYLMSDGYEDQFGGPKNKKFMAKHLKTLLVSISNKDMEEQQVILDQTFENWISASETKQEQIDDVTVLGIRIS